MTPSGFSIGTILNTYEDRSRSASIVFAVK
jgi:hypothetical protein